MVLLAASPPQPPKSQSSKDPTKEALSGALSRLSWISTMLLVPPKRSKICLTSSLYWASSWATVWRLGALPPPCFPHPGGAIATFLEASKSSIHSPPSHRSSKPRTWFMLGTALLSAMAVLARSPAPAPTSPPRSATDPVHEHAAGAEEMHLRELDAGSITLVLVGDLIVQALLNVHHHV